MFRRLISAVLVIAIVHAPLAASAGIVSISAWRPTDFVSPGQRFRTPHPRPTPVSLIVADEAGALARRQLAIVPAATIAPPLLNVRTDWRAASRDPLVLRAVATHGTFAVTPVGAGPASRRGSSPTVRFGARGHVTRPLGAFPAIPTTGVEKWWTYDTAQLPGVGMYATNLSNGNVLVTSADMQVSHRGIPFDFQRTYNSQSLHDTGGSDGGPASLFGNGWTNTFDSYLALNANGTMSVYDDSGARMDYAPTTSASYPTGWMPPAGIHAQLSHNSDGSYDWTTKDGVIHRYWAPSGTTCPSTSVCGRLQYIIGRNHYTNLEFVYAFSNSNHVLSSLLSISIIADDDTAAKPDRAKLLVTSSTGVPLVTSLVYPDAQTKVTFEYDKNNALEAVIEPGNNNSFVAQGYTTVGGQLNSLTDPRYNTPKSTTPCGGGNTVDFFWDSNGRLSSTLYSGDMNFAPNDGVGGLLQTNQPTGCNPFLQNSYTYNQGSTNVGDSDNHSTDYSYDGLGRETQANAHIGKLTDTQSQKWDADNNVIAVTDPRGNTSSFAYDGNGNTTAISEPVSASSDGTSHPLSLFSYDANNNVLSDCEPVTNEANGRTWTGTGTVPPCPVQTGGGVARFTWNTTKASGSDLYEPYGELSDTYTRSGYHKHISYSAYGQGGSDFGLPTSIAGDPVGPQYDSTTISPTLSFGYDARGNAISYNVGTGNWYFTYDSLNRMLTMEDPDGIFGYSYWYPNGQCSGTETMAQHKLEATTPGSARVRYAYDADGDVTLETHHFGGVTGTTSRWYDGADRLVEVSLPYDSTDAYQTPWLTRYDYDLTAGGTISLPAPSGTAATLSGYGNLFGVQIYVPPASKAKVTGWVNLRGYGYDALDRATTLLRTSPSASGQNWAATSAHYDASPQTLGLLSSATDALGHTASFAYDGDGRPTAVQYNDGTPSKTVTYTAAGEVATAYSGTEGTESYSYDLNGALASYTEPKGSSAVTQAGKISYGTYADGSSASVSFTSNSATSPLKLPLLYEYSHRIDGQPTSMDVNYAAGGRSKQTFAWTYTAAGRPTGASDSINTKAYGANYDLLTGQMASYYIPAGEYTSLSYDAEGELLGYGGYTVGPNNAAVSVAYRYNVRGELIKRSTAAATAFLPNYSEHSMQGFDLPDASNGAAQPANIKYDPANGAKLGQYLGSTSMYGSGGNVTSTFGYDAIGRQTARSDVSQGGYTGTVSMTRKYDADDHLIASTCSPAAQCKGAGSLSYGWTASGNLQTMVGDTSRSGVAGYNTSGHAQETLHWSNGQVLFTTNAAGALDDLKIGTLADITSVSSKAGSTPGLTIWDREFDGRQSSYHSSAGNGPWYPPVADPAGGYNLTSKDARGVLFVQQNRTDDISDDTNVFQGDRVFDSTLGHWTTPDPYGGDINDPATLKAYLYDNNNAQSYQDGSGNLPVIGTVVANPAVSSNPIGIAVGVILIIGSFLGLFGGGGGHAPGPPPQAQPHDPGEYIPRGGAGISTTATTACIPCAVAVAVESAEAAAEVDSVGGAIANSVFKTIGRVIARNANALGRAGESAVRGVYDIGPKAAIRVNGRVRIPDGVLGKTISEVKNVQYQSLTRQLQDNIDFTSGPGKAFDLYLPAAARISGPLQQAIRAGSINRLDIPK